MPKQHFFLPNLLIRILLFVGFCIATIACQTQRQTNSQQKEIDGSYNTKRDAYYKVPSKPARNFTAIYTKRTQHYLVGNDCMRKYTRGLGFEYIPYDEYPHNEYGPLSYHFYNLTSRFGLIFKVGIDWKVNVNKRLAECRRGSGDFIGLNTSSED
jgi:hypothetical protein